MVRVVDPLGEERFLFKPDLLLKVLFMLHEQFFLCFVSLSDGPRGDDEDGHQTDEDQRQKCKRHFIETRLDFCREESEIGGYPHIHHPQIFPVRDNDDVEGFLVRNGADNFFPSAHLILM